MQKSITIHTRRVTFLAHVDYWTPIGGTVGFDHRHGWLQLSFIHGSVFLSWRWPWTA